MHPPFVAEGCPLLLAGTLQKRKLISTNDNGHDNGVNDIAEAKTVDNNRKEGKDVAKKIAKESG